MDIEFVKLQSCGRDFILLDGLKAALPDEESLRELSKAILPRHTGIGGYGFLVLHRGREEDVAAEEYDRDGKKKEPSPDAVRCLGRYAFDAGLLSSNHNNLEIKSGHVVLTILDSRNVAVQLPPPNVLGIELPSPGIAESDIDQWFSRKNISFPFTPVNLSSLHAVYFDYNEHPPLKILKGLSRHSVFTVPADVVFVKVMSQEKIHLRVWNSDVRELPSSGAAGGAAVVSAALHGFTDKDVLAHSRGGDLFIQWDERSSFITIAGPVDYVFTGTYYWETWETEAG